MFVTVSSEKKTRLFKHLYAIPNDQAFNSRNTSFSRHKQNASNASIDIEDSKLSMEWFSNSVTFYAVAMDKSSTHRLSRSVVRALQSVLEMIGNSSMRVASSLYLYTNLEH